MSSSPDSEAFVPPAKQGVSSGRRIAHGGNVAAICELPALCQGQPVGAEVKQLPQLGKRSRVLSCLERASPSCSTSPGCDVLPPLRGKEGLGTQRWSWGCGVRVVCMSLVDEREPG